MLYSIVTSHKKVLYCENSDHPNLYNITFPQNQLLVKFRVQRRTKDAITESFAPIHTTNTLTRGFRKTLTQTNLPHCDTSGNRNTELHP